ncbi:hypothetical protein GCM10009092_30720 [Bowmanella denitrificans]|uniref:Uncharacterized protein n=1 Tax=Bowmanella denitrificans TaxID=366582 RepID=A0ABN0XI62_9ALTE
MTGVFFYLLYPRGMLNPSGFDYNVGSVFTHPIPEVRPLDQLKLLMVAPGNHAEQPQAGPQGEGQEARSNPLSNT